ncbi:MAG: hypothetical protein PVS2B2_01110 [Candidatus Acidiferrum sp.]
MAVAGWRIWCVAPSAARTSALFLFALQLFLNFLWSPVFFQFHRLGLALFVIAGLWLLIGDFIALAWKFERIAAYLFMPYLLWVSFAGALNIAIWKLNAPSLPVAALQGSPDSLDRATAVAMRFAGAPDAAGFPTNDTWTSAPAHYFDADWQGKNADPQRGTTVQLLWTPETLFLRFTARYRSLTVFSDSDADGRRYQLWDRDVAEAFLQTDSSDPWQYKEFEVSPNGFWVDLDISQGKNENLHSGLRRRVSIDEQKKTWRADLALPIKCLTPKFDASIPWRVNFFRVEGSAEPRFYSAWRPTNSLQPNFHVPEAFGKLLFEEGSSR